MHISAWLDCLTKFPNHITMHQSRACAGICRALQGHDKVEGCSAMGLYRKGMKEQVVGIRGAGQEPYQTVKHGCVTEIGWHAWPLLIKLQSHAKYSIQQFAWLKSDILDMSGKCWALPTRRSSNRINPEWSSGLWLWSSLDILSSKSKKKKIVNHRCILGSLESIPHVKYSRIQQASSGPNHATINSHKVAAYSTGWNQLQYLCRGCSKFYLSGPKFIVSWHLTVTFPYSLDM